jgi:hypothetical protein
MQEYRVQTGSPPLLQYLATSPAILVGFIDAVEQASGIHSSKYGGQPVQLYRVKVTVENVLQGQVASNKVNVYCFMKRGSEGGMARMNFAPGYRCIFYLRKEAGEWRTACDIYEYCVDRVLTGRHTTFRRNPNRPVSEDILELVYTRGEGVSDGEMVDALASPRNFGFRWRDEKDEVYIKLLKQMAKVETSPVRAEACEQLKKLNNPCK